MVSLECDPTGGSHPNAKAACQDLLAADGELDQIGGDDQLTACTMEYRPVTASANGQWNGKPVTWNEEFPNNCTLTTATGTVFDF